MLWMITFLVLNTLEPGDTQLCDVTVTIPFNGLTPQRVAVEQDTADVICVRCLSPQKMTSSDTVFTLPTRIINPGQRVSGVGANVLGTLQITPSVIKDGVLGFGPFVCAVDGDINSGIVLYTTNLVANITNPSPIVEGRSAALECKNLSPPEVSMGQQWFKRGQGQAISTSSTLQFNPSQRTDAGEYTCRISSRLNSDTLQKVANVVVEFSPDVTSTTGPTMRLNLNSDLSLTCSYEAVPAPTVEWFLNGTTSLNPRSNRRLILDTNSERSRLNLMDLRQNEGGDYSCKVTNRRGSVTQKLATVEILFPKVHVGSVRVVGTTETTIQLEWTVESSDIANIVVTYSRQGQSRPSSVSPQPSSRGVTLMRLMPGTTYDITVHFENSFGQTASNSVTGRTEAPKVSVGSVRVAGTTDTTIQLEWTVITSDITKIVVTYSRRGQSRSSSVSPQPSSRGVTLMRLMPRTIYDISVRFENSFKQAVTKSVTATTKEGSRGSAQLSVVHSGATTIELEWTVTNTDVANIEVKYLVEGQAKTSSVYPPSNSGGITLTKLMPQTTYDITVIFEDDSGQTISKSVRATTIARQIGMARLRVVRTAETSIQLEWAIINMDVSRIMVTYFIEGQTMTFAEFPAANARGITLNRLQPQTTYNISVLFENSLGQELIRSVKVTTQAPQVQVTSLEVVDTRDTTIRVEWIVRSRDITRIQVIYFREGQTASSQSLPSNSSGVTLTNLQPQTTYNITVEFTNSFRQTTTRSVTATTRVMEIFKGSVSVANTTESTIELIWIVRGSNVARVVVTYAIKGRGSTSSVAPFKLSRRVTLIKLRPRTTYDILVYFESHSGRNFSKSVRATTLAQALTNPPVINIFAETSVQLRIFWTPHASTRETATGDIVWLVEFRKSATTSSPPGPTISKRVKTQMITFEDTAKGMKIEKGTLYEARVRGENSRGPGPFSEYASAETLVDPPSKPLRVTASGVSYTAVSIRWLPPSDNGGRPIVGYIVAIHVSNQSDPIEKETTKTSHVFANFPGVQPETTYRLSVRAVNSEELVGEPAEADGTTLEIPLPLRIKNPPGVGDVTNGSAHMTWSNPGGKITGYIIAVSEGGGTPMTTRVRGLQTSYTVVDLNAGTDYRVFIVSVNTAGHSKPSPSATFRTIDADEPVVRGPMNAVMATSDIVLTCITPDIRPITWENVNGIKNSSNSTFTVHGNLVRSRLVIRNVQMSHGGLYQCRVGGLTATYTLDVVEAAAAVIVEGIFGYSFPAIFIFLASVGAILILSVCCVCCCCIHCRLDKDVSEYSSSADSTSYNTSYDSTSNTTFSTATTFSSFDS